MIRENMRFLGIDYGERKIGLAVGDTESRFAEPLAVVRFEEKKEAIERISQYATVERVENLVLGISEGKTAEKTRNFGAKLSKKVKLPILYYDETLTTHDAQKLAISARIGRKKRKAKEDSYAAAIMLQNFLESNC
jgi:putative Holliday junction resolvase